MSELNNDEMLFADEDTQKGKYLIFTIGDENYGIEIKYVTEIIGIQNITEVPDMPSHIKGVINLRGKIIPVMDVRLRFGKNVRAYDDRTCIIVIEIDSITIGLIIDRVSEVVVIPDDMLLPPPNIGQGFHHKYIKGIGKLGEEVKLILDCHKLLNDDELALVAEIE